MKRKFLSSAVTLLLCACGRPEVVPDAPAELSSTSQIRETDLHLASHPVPAPQEQSDEKDSVADLAFRSLINGNTRYASGFSTRPNQGTETRAALVNGQRPHAIVLSCSDSRVAPEIIFDQGLGDLFVIRTAGHVPDPASIASIEYAVEHLASRLIVVLGHSSCGAVTAAMKTPQGKSAGSEHLDALLASIRPNTERFTEKTAGTGLVKAVESNVQGTAQALATRSRIIHEAMEKHGLKIVEGVYHLDTGTVRFLNRY